MAAALAHMSPPTPATSRRSGGAGCQPRCRAADAGGGGRDGWLPPEALDFGRRAGAPAQLPASPFSSTEVFVNGLGAGGASPTPLPCARCGAHPACGPGGSRSAVVFDAMLGEGSDPSPNGRDASTDNFEDLVNMLLREALSMPLPSRSARPDPKSEGLPRSRSLCAQRTQPISVVRHPPESREAEAPEAIILFLPGASGGVGPCRKEGLGHDESALFPTLARNLSSSLPMVCYRVSWKSTAPDLGDITSEVCDLALSALKRAHRPAAPVPIILVGHSFGAAVALQAASKLRDSVPADSGYVAGVVALSPQVVGAKEVVPALSGTPLLFVHSVDDEVVWVMSGLRLHDIAQEPKEIKLFRSGGHNFAGHGAELRSTLRDWILSKAQIDESPQPPLPNTAHAPGGGAESSLGAPVQSA